jgi:hypothetical protein
MNYMKQLEIKKQIVEINAMTNKIQKESRWYPLIVSLGGIVSIVGFGCLMILQ